MDFKITPMTTYKNNNIRLEIKESQWFDSPFDCNPVCPDGRPIALVVTGHRYWEADANLTDQGFKKDKGETLAKQWFKNHYGKSATLIVPIWAYQHGMVSLERSPSCQWDSGFLGFVVLRKGAFKGRDYDKVIDSYLREWTSYFNNEAYAYSLKVDSEHYNDDHCGGFEGDFESCGLIDNLESEHGMALRVLFDDDTLTAREIIRDFGRVFTRKLSESKSKIGSMCKDYFAKEEV